MTKNFILDAAGVLNTVLNDNNSSSNNNNNNNKIRAQTEEIHHNDIATILQNMIINIKYHYA